jgi:hypothetical protein
MTYCQYAKYGSGFWGACFGSRISERTNRKYNMHLGDHEIARKAGDLMLVIGNL